MNLQRYCYVRYTWWHTAMREERYLLRCTSDLRRPRPDGERAAVHAIRRMSRPIIGTASCEELDGVYRSCNDTPPG